MPEPNDVFEVMHTTRAMRRLKPDPVPDTLIRKILEAGSPAATLLMGRGLRELQKDADDDAIDDFDAALTLEPELADAYYHRALARFHEGDYRGALADIEATLRREPRHFAALKSLSRIAESRDDYRGALAAWKKVLELSPNTPDGQLRLKLLEKKALGEES